jgi:chromosomal replication initiator protein
MKDQFTFEDSEVNLPLQAAWKSVILRMAAEVHEATLNRYMRPLEPISIEGRLVRLAAPGKFMQEWVRERFSGMIQSYLSDELGFSVELEIVARPRDRREIDEDRIVPASSQPAIAPIVRFEPNPAFVFENFIVGDSNRLAFAGSNAVADEPAGKYNPLFIWGASGLGKTHLLHAIAAKLKAKDPNIHIVFVSAQQFAEDFIQALQANRVEQFRRQHREVKIWLLDDIQQLAGKDKTQEEIFHTFNFLQQSGAQIVLTSDRPPKDIYRMDERLRSRLESGLVADVLSPNTETRCAIILSKAKARGVNLDFEVAMFLAKSVPGNIRILEGAITKLVALSSLTDEVIDLTFAEKVVEQYFQADYSKPGFNQIVQLVSEKLNISVEEIKGASRKAPVVHARHITVYLTRRITGDSWKHIGSHLGDRDHTSIMHGYQKIDDMMHHDKELLSQVKTLMKQLQA